MTKDPIKLCPECGNENVKRLIGAGGGLIFKGGGFYITDYRSKSYQSKKKEEKVSAESAPKPNPPKEGNGCKPDVG